ncbi:MAG TPA: hypothetical protein VI072_30925 [Polyangiaceae bacterium]
MTRIASIFVLLAAVGSGCSWSGSEASDSTRVAHRNRAAEPVRQQEPQRAQLEPKQIEEPQPSEQQSPHEPLPLKKPEKVSLALAKTAGTILLDNREKPLGTTVPFVHSGHRYLARIEMHDNPENNPLRPPGRHKGITVYER